MKAVVLGTNYYIGLSVLRCLGRVGVHTVACDYDRKSYGMKSRWISERLWVHDIKKDREALVNDLVSYARSQAEKPLLLPTHDSYAELIDDNFQVLKEYFVFPQTVPGLVRACSDKSQLLELAAANGVLMPATLNADAPDLWEQIPDKIGYPCIVKPDDTAAFTARFRSKVFKVRDQEELAQVLAVCKENQMSVKVQQIIEGFDDHMYTYDAYLDSTGKVTHAMTAHKQRQWPINFGASTFIKQEYVPELMEVGKKFLEEIGWRGFAEIEFKKDARSGKFYLIEINVRTTNFNQMIDSCGINMPYVAWRDMKGDPLPEKIITTDVGEAFCCNYEDKAARKAYVETGQLTVEQIAAQNAGLQVTEAIFARDDLRPWLRFLLNRATRVRKRFVNKFFGK